MGGKTLYEWFNVRSTVTGKEIKQKQNRKGIYLGDDVL